MSDLMNAIEREYSESKLVGAIQATGLIRPDLAGQVAALVGDHYALTVGVSGRPELAAKSGKALNDDLVERLGAQNFEHFRPPHRPGYGPDGRYSRDLHIRQNVALATRGADGGAVGLRGQYAQQK